MMLCYSRLTPSLNLTLSLVRTGAIVDASVVRYPLEAKRQSHLSSSGTRQWASTGSRQGLKAPKGCGEARSLGKERETL